MAIYVDTSALYALLDTSDRSHSAARGIWAPWLEEPEYFITSNYVLLESLSLIQRRLGMGAARRVQEELAPLFQVHWIDAELHAAATSVFLSAGLRDLSLVDCTSFELMRRLGLRTVFAFDRHFAEQGFDCRP